jgi:hypothetical protein
MAVWYLDDHDEITDAVARLRNATDEAVVFVVPPGSRIATGRINFKLLEREAAARGLTMAVASPDEQVRAMAASAGVLAYATPSEAEAALERGVVAEVEREAAPTEGPAPGAAAGEAEAAAGTLMWRSQRMRLTTVAGLVLAVVAAFLVLQISPTAEITLTPRVAGLGPLSVEVTAAAAIDAPDPVAGTIPAAVMSIPLSTENLYRSSGIRSVETRATGKVVFSSPLQEINQDIRAGTRLQTPAGTEFRTTETVTLPRSISGTPATVSAPIEAIAGGEVGNVPAEAISIVPSLEVQGISVSNPEPTSGGRFEEDPLITAADYDAAAVDLRNRLSGELAAYLRDASNVPEGLTLFAETALLGQVVLMPPARELVGATAPEFELAASAAASALAVDESAIGTVLRARLDMALPDGMRLLDGTVSVEHDEGTVEGDRIAYLGTATARMTPIIDAEELALRMAGLPVSEAQAILDGLGTATVNVWPGFLGHLPSEREHISLDILEASATE